MVVIRPVDDESVPVQTIPEDHEGSDVSELKRPDLPEQIITVLNKYSEVFAKDLPAGVPPVRKGHQFHIELEDGAQPVNRPLYKLSPLELEEVKRQLDYLLQQGYARPSESPWGAPIIFAPKKDGGLRMCLDYRWLNKVTKKNKYLLPLPEELMGRLARAQIFSKLDLRSGYWQMPVREQDIEKTAFKCRYDQFEFLVCPFGVTNAPPQFQAMVNDLFADMIDNFLVVFLDDLIVYSRDMAEHTQHLKAVLARLKEHKLFAKASKTQIGVSSTDFVGHWISGDGVSPMPVKIRAIQQWKKLETVTDVRSFLGMVSFYRRYIRRFAEIAGPLHDLTRKNVVWRWGPRQEQAFEDLKKALTTAPVLILPNPRLPYLVVTDGSDMAIGAVIMQDQGKGHQPIAFLSRRLRPAETRYSPYDKEMLGISYALSQWRHYLEGCVGGVTVMTDQQPATTFMEQKNLSCTQARWLKSGYFESIMPVMKYIPGKANVVADALSRSYTVQNHPDSVARVQCAAVPCVEESEREAWLHALSTDAGTRDVLVKLNMGQVVRGYSVDQSGILYY